MGDPARSPRAAAVVWDDEQEPSPRASAVVWDGEPPLPPMGEGTPPPAPPGPVPALPVADQVHPLETTAHELGAGAGFELTDHVAAGAEAVGNWLKARGLDPLDPRSGRPAETAGRGMDAPLKGYADYLADRTARRELGARQNPGTALGANLAGSLTGGAFAPQVKAAQGAGLLARGAAGAANVAVDTGVAAGTAAAAAPPGQRLDAATDALAPAAGLSTILRAPGAAKAGIDAARRTALTVLPEDVRPAAKVLSTVGEEGASARAAARRGQQTIEPTTRKITSTLSQAEDLTDSVLNYAKVGLKRAPVAKAMATEGVDAQRAVMQSGQSVEQIALRLDELTERIGDFEPAGRQAIRKAKDAVDGMRDEFADALAQTGETGAQDAAADLFMKVDQLKRRIGKAVKSAGRGNNADAGAEDELIDMYHGLRDLLEDGKTWGEGAATIQREINAAWTPWLTKRRAYTKTLLADEPIERGASGFDELLDADPKKVQSVLGEAGTAGNERRERILSEGLDTATDLTRTLAKYYDAPPEVVEKAARVAQGASEIKDTFGKTRGDLVAARELRDVSAQSPRLGKVINVASAAEDAVRSNPALAATARVIGKAADVAGMVAEPARKAAAGQTGRASAAERNETLLERVRTVSKSDPEALGQFGQQLAASRTPDEFAVRHASLMATDADYRRRIRRLSERDQKAEERGGEPQPQETEE
jgi:hypothetical protein